MHVHVLFFGATAAIAGTSRIQLELSASTAGEIFKRIVTDYPALSRHRLLFSVNQKYATGNEVVHDGDELAIFTAVSGG